VTVVQLDTLQCPGLAALAGLGQCSGDLGWILVLVALRTAFASRG